ncbi:MAG: class I SAM-dependent methyltransferase [Pseudomonadota bacterium]
MEAGQNMYSHFAQVASNYRQVRTTDPEVILFIAEILNNKKDIKAADVGCGDGRYDLLLFHHLNNLHLTCIDINEHMLKQVSRYLSDHEISNYKTMKSDAGGVPLKDNSMDCILTFNAIHHFDFAKFVEKCWKVLKEDGKIFIYTRLRSQNAKNIWGLYFPFFLEKETRLYELNEIEEHIQASGLLALEKVQCFQYQRNSTLSRLVEKAKAKHYSTFSLYLENEFNESLNVFQENIRKTFPNTDRIEWVDENILLVLTPK